MTVGALGVVLFLLGWVVVRMQAENREKLERIGKKFEEKRRQWRDHYRNALEALSPRLTREQFVRDEDYQRYCITMEAVDDRLRTALEEIRAYRKGLEEEVEKETGIETKKLGDMMGTTREQRPGR